VGCGLGCRSEKILCLIQRGFWRGCGLGCKLEKILGLIHVDSSVGCWVVDRRKIYV
jgi:hypothetical protein